MFPNLPDTFPKMLVYIGVGLTVATGYLYINSLDKMERFQDELSEKRTEHVYAMHEDSFARLSMRTALIDAETLTLIIKNPQENFESMIEDSSLSQTTYLSLVKSKFSPDSAYSILKRVKGSMRNSLEEMLKYDSLSKYSRAKVDNLNTKIKIVTRKNLVFLVLGIAGLPLLLLGLIRWYKTDSKTNALLDIEIELKKQELLRMRT